MIDWSHRVGSLPMRCLLYITQRADRSGALLPVERPWFFPLPDVLCDKINKIYSELKKNPEFDPQNAFIVHRYKSIINISDN